MSWPKKTRQAWYQSLTTEERAALQYSWAFWGRPNQQEPKEKPWLVWLLLAGRGFGKTRCGAEWVINRARSVPGARIALVGATAADVRDVMIRGNSGILACSPPWFYPTYEPSKRLLTWPNGSTATAYSADSPDRLRGPQHDFAWCDELAAWSRGQDAYDQLMLGLRLGQAPQCVITTTPRPIKLLKNIMAAPDTHTTTGTTYENLGNLAPTFKRTILAKYEGTRIGNQELRAQILEYSQNALWNPDMLEKCRIPSAPLHMRRIVVAVDPATTSDDEKKGNNTGIIAAGLGLDGLYYVLKDATLRDKPHIWAKRAAELYHFLKADKLVAEVNQGGDMVETILKVVDPTVSVKNINARRSKFVRAEPVAALYEKGLVRHVGVFPELEDEMCNFDPLAPRQGLKGASDSPDRLDALTHCLTELNSKNKPLGLIHFAGTERQNPYKDM